MTVTQKVLASTATFILSALIHCGLAWLAGYNFDHRGLNVFCFASQTLFDSAFLASWIFLPETTKGTKQ